MRQRYVLPTGLLLLLLVSGCGQSERLDKPVSHLLSDSSCDPLSSPCLSQSGSRVVSLFFPATIHYLQPFEMQVVATGFGPNEITRVTVSFAMSDMDMGINRFGLRKEKLQNATSVYSGSGMLPVCVSGRRDWQATVELESKDSVYMAQYRLRVDGAQ